MDYDNMTGFNDMVFGKQKKKSLFDDPEYALPKIEISKFEMPKLELPQYEFPKIEPIVPIRLATQRELDGDFDPIYFNPRYHGGKLIPHLTPMMEHDLISGL